MESSAYPMLFSPIKVGTTEVKNRVFMPPVSTNLADHGYVTDDLVDHYRARAKGGVGLIITEVVTVEPTYTYLPGDMCCYDDTFIPGWEKLAAAVHEYGCKIMPQLFHPAYMAFNIPGTPRLIAPSFVGPSYAREAPRPITVDEIHELTHQFGDAAVRMQKAGVDGVEVHAAHAHGMLGGFLTPLYNKRTDEYGGSFENRVRYALEVVAAIKEAAPQLMVEYKLPVIMENPDGTPRGKGGLQPDEACEFAKLLEGAGIDMIQVAQANHTGNMGDTIPPMGAMPYNWTLPVAERVKALVSVPVATVGRVVSVEAGEKILEDGAADIIAYGRSLMCDPDIALKAATGEPIRECLNCNKTASTSRACSTPRTATRRPSPLSRARATRRSPWWAAVLPAWRPHAWRPSAATT